MDASTDFDDTVAFEIPTFTVANRLASRLRPTWCVRIEDLGHAWVVTVELRREEADLAVLLRDVESWTAGSGLGGLRFRLDGRDYVLAASDVLLETAG